ncbi:MAG TPA: DUF3795 domain-containing protein [Syntrophomonadaceae bacterium]|nr:DUF3795 domain-containing protein [Syntrophomonadaceae bacterium]
MRPQKVMKIKMIAPCGMNCGICIAHLRDKNKCPGCNGDNKDKPKTRLQCKIKTCPELLKSQFKYCGSCHSFPCNRLKQLDKRYRTKYGMSMIVNLEKIGDIGLSRFVQEEIKRWTCSECGHTLCAHKETCLNCGGRRDKELSLYYYGGKGIQNPSQIISDIAQKDYDQAKYIEEIQLNVELRELVIEQMLSNPDIMVYYHCYEIVSAASYSNPELFYKYWDRIKELLHHKNSYHRDVGLTILANLTRVDDQELTKDIIDAYLDLLQDVKFMTACCCVKNCSKIIVNKPLLTGRVLTALLDVEQSCPYPDKQKALFIGYIIEVFDRVFDACENKPALLSFAQRHAGNTSPKTRKTAKLFIDKHS